MSNYWILLTVHCFAMVDLQFAIGQTIPEGTWDSISNRENYPPLPYAHYQIRPPVPNEIENAEYEAYQTNVGPQSPAIRKKRVIDDKYSATQWLPGIGDDIYVNDDDKEIPLIIPGFNTEANATDYLEKDKRSFSPWGGKRDSAGLEYMWTWKRAANMREPTMPKRVRFSPWGGKRSGQMIYKPGSKASKLVSSYSPSGTQFNLDGLKFIPGFQKHLFQIMSLSTKTDEKSMREELPFKNFIESLPRLFRPGHPYSDVILKKDGKRKVKFSTWGGKRSPPIIGPIWTKGRPGSNDSVLDALLLVTNSEDREAVPKL